MTNQDQPAGRRPSKLAAALQNALTRVHSVFYRSSNGVIGGRIASSPVLLLTTTGRRSGKQRTVPLLYFDQSKNFAERIGIPGCEEAANRRTRKGHRGETKIGGFLVCAR